MIRRSDVPLASAERRYRAPRNDEEREKARAAAYHQAGLVTIDLNEPLSWPFRCEVEQWAEKRWGTRLGKVKSQEGAE